MITEARAQDLPALVPLLRDLNALHADRVPAMYHDDGSDAEIEAVLRGMVEEGARILIYVTEGVPRAYLLWKPNRAPVEALECPLRLAVLDHIYVAPIWRKRGMARRLVARFEADIEKAGFEGWRVSVHRFNAASVALMQNTGARPAVVTYLKL